MFLLPLKVPLTAKKAGEDFLEGLQKVMGEAVPVKVGPGCVFEVFMDAGVFFFRDISCLSFFIYLSEF